jgi:DHA1 family bicyclomycin/chloramphenicol resistance-like MFS transporter
MAVIPSLAGTAAGIGVFMQNFCGAIFTQVYGLIADGTPRPMILVVSLSGLLCLLVGALPFWLALRGRTGRAPGA